MSVAIEEISKLVDIWDFTKTGRLTDRSEFWFDQSHFSAILGKMMLRRMFGEEMPPDWTRLGQLRESKVMTKTY